MKLTIVGVVVFVLGLVVGVEGLAGTGVLWIATGLVLKAIAPPKRPKAGSAPDAEAGEEAQDELRASPRTLVMAAIVVVVGGVSIAVGLLEIGFGELDRDLRWVPIIGGGLMAATQVLAGLLYALGSGMSAAADAIGVPDHPATITVLSVQETSVSINDRPQLAFELIVQPDGYPQYELSKRMTVGFIHLGMVRAGTAYRGKVDLDDLLRDGLISAEEHAQARGRILGSL